MHREQGRGAKASISSYPDKGWKFRTVKKVCSRVIRTGSAVLHKPSRSGRPATASACAGLQTSKTATSEQQTENKFTNRHRAVCQRQLSYLSKNVMSSVGLGDYSAFRNYLSVVLCNAGDTAACVLEDCVYCILQQVVRAIIAHWRQACDINIIDVMSKK